MGARCDRDGQRQGQQPNRAPVGEGVQVGAVDGGHDGAEELRGRHVAPLEAVAVERGGGVSRDEMYRVFNMGVGMVVVASDEDADEIIGKARVAGVTGWVMGDIRPGSGNVVIS